MLVTPERWYVVFWILLGVVYLLAQGVVMYVVITRPLLRAFGKL